MLRVIIRQARPGMMLARSIVNPRQPEQTLLAAGFKLDPRTIARLHELGVYDLWVHYPGLEYLDDLYSPELTTQQQRLCQTLQSSLIEHAQQSDVALPAQDHRMVVEDLVHAILNAHTLPFMSALRDVEDALLRHSAEVCVLGVTLGLKLDGYLVDQRKRRMNSKFAKDVVNLGVGCMFHDFGELQLQEKSRESRRSFFELDNDNKEWRRHAELGFSALRGQIEASAATVILNHHQHFDGSGFPACGQSNQPQRGTDIHVFARIAMAADTFQHVLHEGGIPRPTICALWQIQQSPLRQWFDPVVLQALLEVVRPFIPGMVVKLSDGRQAIVTRTFAGAPCYPEVQILDSADLMNPANMRDEREVVNLSTNQKLSVEAVDGTPVGQFMYGARRPIPLLKCLPVQTPALGVAV